MLFLIKQSKNSIKKLIQIGISTSGKSPIMTKIIEIEI